MIFRQPNPDHHYGFQSDGIGWYLPKVRVVGLVELVFSEHQFPVRQAFAKSVGAEITNRLLVWLQFQPQADRLTEDGNLMQMRGVGRGHGGDSNQLSGFKISAIIYY